LVAIVKLAVRNSVLGSYLTPDVSILQSACNPNRSPTSLLHIAQEAPIPTLFPYTTLFRSTEQQHLGVEQLQLAGDVDFAGQLKLDRKSTRLNSSHGSTSYAVFCFKKQLDIVVTEDWHRRIWFELNR